MPISHSPRAYAIESSRQCSEFGYANYSRNDEFLMRLLKEEFRVLYDFRYLWSSCTRTSILSRTDTGHGSGDLHLFRNSYSKPLAAVALLVHFLERTTYFPHDALNLRSVTTCTPLEQSGVVPRDLFDYLRETRVLPQTISVCGAKQKLMGSFGDGKVEDNALLNANAGTSNIRYVPHASEVI